MTPRDDEFWEHEDRIIKDEFDPLVMSALLQGIDAGVQILPDGIRQLISFDLINENAIDYLMRYHDTILTNINATTRAQVIKRINDWIISGEHLDRLTESLTPLFGETRAAMIAATEVTRVYAEGNIMTWRATGVVTGKEWRTARDERVCPYCGPLHMTVVQLESDFQLTADQLANSKQVKALLGKNYTPEKGLLKAMSLLRSGGSRAFAPPYHPRCRCYLVPFVGEDAVGSQLDSILGL